MRITLTVVRPPAAECDDVVVDAPPNTPLGEIVAHLCATTGVSPPVPAFVGDVPLDPLTPLSRSPLHDGVVVVLDGHGSPHRVESCADRRPRRAYLELRVSGGPDAGRVLPLPFGSTTVGRGVTSDIALDDPDLSRLHAVLELTEDGAVLRDAGSTNGTFVDASPVSGAHPLPTGARVRVGESTLQLVVPNELPAVLHSRSDGTLSYNRPPRLDAPAADSPAPSLEFPTPPAAPPAPKPPVIATVAPLAAGLLLAAVMRRPEFLLFTALSPVMMGGQWLAERRRQRRARRSEHAEFDAARSAVERRLCDLLAEETVERHRSAPDLATLAKIARGPTTRLWERRPTDPDFLQLRLGSGKQPARIHVGGGIATAAPALSDVPVTVSLPAVGVLGIAAPPARQAALARALIGQLTVLHSPRDVVLVLLTDGARAESWAWARWLPHLQPTVSAACQALIGVDPETRTSRVSELAALIERRRADGATSRGRPAAVLVLDGARSLRATPGLAEVLAHGPAYGVYAICLDDDPASLPEECAAVAVTTGDVATRLSIRTSSLPDAAEVIADGASIAWAEGLSRALAPVRDETPGNTNVSLPDNVRWLDVVAATSELTDHLLTLWSDAGHGTTRVAVGAGLDGVFAIDLAADGPHALVAGTTGAGKSELLQTLVTSLAFANRPDELTFVLIDYKGGAAFGPCIDLPHTVGLVTDLDGVLVERALTSLSAELKRREAILATVGAADINGYRAAGGALARLVIVVDEFASLAAELPEFVGGLVGIAQRGRSLGVHLVLATQRPEGVISADIRANTNLRICLGVTRESDSRDVIDAPDAARISRATPGRGFARTGHGELHAFQAGRVSAPARTTIDDVQVRRSPFRSLGSAVTPHARAVGGASKTDLDLIVAACREVALRLHVETPASPWLPPLSDVVVLDRTAQRPLAAAFALLDRPAEQRREPYVFDLTTAGHLLVAGSPRSGRSTVARTLAAGLAIATSSADVHLYAIDCGGGGLAALTQLAHCGAVVAGHEPERASRLVSILTRELAHRQAVLGGAGLSSITEQRARDSNPLPHLVLVVDGWEAMVSSFDDHDGGAVIDGIFRLLREGAALGIHVVVTAERTGLVGRLASSIDRRVVLRLADRSDFALIGLPARTVPDDMAAGRGFCAEDLTALQAYLLTPDPSGRAQLAAFAEIADAANARDRKVSRERRPRRIDPLPSRITLRELDPPTEPDDVGGGEPLASPQVVLGVGGDETAPITVDLADPGPGFVIAGPARSGRSTALATIAANLRATGRRVLLVAPRPTVAREFADHVVPPDDPELATLLLDATAPLAVLVDDAERVADSPAAAALDVFVRTVRDSEHVVAVAGTNEELSVGFRGFVVEARRSRTGLLLAPRSPLDGDVLGVRLPRHTAAVSPPGRGFLVAHGRLLPMQVALPA